MAGSTDKIRTELESFGYSTSVFESPMGTVVSFDYTIEAGSHKNESVTVGVSFQEDAYPEYPPHWIHVTPPLEDGRAGSARQYTDDLGRLWHAMSRPPGELWDRLRTKHMGFFISEHLRRIWMEV